MPRGKSRQITPSESEIPASFPLLALGEIVFRSCILNRNISIHLYIQAASTQNKLTRLDPIDSEFWEEELKSNIYV
ncbi:MAG: hypothetical protein ACRCT1_23695 [Microcoleaceae cyanobacterium]|jgi:hypothetical protein